MSSSSNGSHPTDTPPVTPSETIQSYVRRLYDDPTIIQAESISYSEI
jgi:hypothetical protein